MNNIILSRHVLRFVLYIAILFAVVACSSPQLISSPSPGLALPTQPFAVSRTPRPNLTATNPNLATIQLVPSWTPWPEPTKLLLITPTSSAMPPNLWSSFTSLPPGQYVVYFDTQQKKDGLYVISQDSRVQEHLIANYGHAISTDGRKIIYMDDRGHEVMLDMEHNTLTELYTPVAGCTFFNASPDLSKFVMSCHGEVHIVSIEDQNSVPVTHMARQQEHYEFPLWSPDGKWIALFNITYPPDRFPDPDDGLYLIDTSCLSEPSTCPTKMRGPFQDNLYLQGPYVWSPDSQKLAIPARSDDHPIKIFDLKTDTFHDLDLNGGYGPIDSFAWSPDGLWIAYSRRESETDSTQDIFLVPVAGGDSISLIDSSGSASVYFWLTVPWLFRPGDTYSVTDAGANINLRQSPALVAKALKKLKPGDLIRIISGPVEADGYHWWQILTVGDGTEGWAVEHPDWYKPVN